MLKYEVTISKIYILSPFQKSTLKVLKIFINYTKTIDLDRAKVLSEHS
jgi:hypothetical protein